MKPDRTQGARAKLDRSKQLLAELNNAVNQFFDSDPYQVGTKRDPERRLVYHVTSVTQPPVALSLLAGEIVHGL